MVRTNKIIGVYIGVGGRESDVRMSVVTECNKKREMRIRKTLRED